MKRQILIRLFICSRLYIYRYCNPMQGIYQIGRNWWKTLSSRKHICLVFSWYQLRFWKHYWLLPRKRSQRTNCFWWYDIWVNESFIRGRNLNISIVFVKNPISLFQITLNSMQRTTLSLEFLLLDVNFYL